MCFTCPLLCLTFKLIVRFYLVCFTFPLVSLTFKLIVCFYLVHVGGYQLCPPLFLLTHLVCMWRVISFTVLEILLARLVFMCVFLQRRILPLALPSLLSFHFYVNNPWKFLPFSFLTMEANTQSDEGSIEEQHQSRSIEEKHQLVQGKHVSNFLVWFSD